MAREVTVLLIDDIDGTEATQTVTFALDGATYEIDLNDDHAEQLRSALEPFMKAGRRARGGTSTPRKNQGASKDTARIRQWAKDNGFTISSRGRIPAQVVEAYRKQHA